MSPLQRQLSPCLALTLILGLAGSGFAQVGSGNLSVLQIGDGSAALSNASTAFFINQFTVAGAPVGTPLAIPSTGTGALTISGNSATEGYLSRSTDGQFLIFAAYNSIPGVVNIAQTSAATAQRAVGRVDILGNLTSTLLGPNAYSGSGSAASNIRTAVSTNGTDIWTSGTVSGAAPATGGTHYTAFGSGTATQISTTPSNTRNLAIINGQLYTGSASGANVGVNTVGTGLPTTAGQTTTLVFTSTAGTGTPSPYGYVGLDNPVNPVVGVDTFYIADDRTVATGGGLQRWSFNGTTWTLGATVAPTGTVGLRGVAASISGNVVSLYATSAEASANRLVTINDVLSASGGTFDAGGFVNLANAPTNTVYRGVTFSPVPEPTSLLALCAAAGGVAFRLRRKKA